MLLIYAYKRIVSDMQEKISKLEKESEIVCLKINIAKTKELRVNPKTQKQLNIGNQEY
jgi:hypothetical protein